MVAGDLDFLGDFCEEVCGAVVDFAGFAVEDVFGGDDTRAEEFADQFVAEADAEDGDVFVEGFDDFWADATFLRAAGAGGDEDF